MMRLIQLGSSALLLAITVGFPAATHAAAPRAANLGAVNSIFVGYMTQGPDAGMKVEGLLSLSGGTGTLTLGDGTAPAASAGVTSSGVTMTVALPNGAVSGTGAANGASLFIGTLTGPKAGDQGFWTAQVATAVLDYAVTANISRGPHRGQSVLIGDLYGYVGADGSLFGKYVDNSKAGPGIVAKVYPVHGSFVNNILTAGIAFSPRTAYGLVGRVGKFYGQDEVSGSVIGPTSRDTGTWAGLSNAATA
jgi:hypothetical protein